MSEMRNLFTTFSILLILLAGKVDSPADVAVSDLMQTRSYVIAVMWVLYAGFL